MPKLPITLPAIGKMGNVYSKTLLIATLAMTMDQSLTAILQTVNIKILVNDIQSIVK